MRGVTQMSQDNRETAKKDGNMLTISIISLLVVLLFIIEVYEIINDPANLIAIGALGVFILSAVYAQMHLIGRMMKKRQAEQEEAFNNVYRSEKASYLLMRKYFDQMEEKMDLFSSQIGAPYKDLVAAQKALAKVQINRSKQNANTLLISNDKMLHKISEFQKEIANAKNGLSEQDKAAFLDGNKDIIEKQQEILAALQELEGSLKNEILESANKIASMKTQQMAIQESQVLKEDTPQLQSLDLEDQTGLNEELLLQPAVENSSESDLDKLLMGINSEIPESKPLDDEMQLPPMMEEPEIKPLTEEPQLQPMIEEPELLPISEEPQLSPIMEEPELGTIGDLDTGLVSDLVDDNIKISDEISAMMADMDLSEDGEDLGLPPMMEEPEIKPLTEKPQLQPIIEESGHEPITEEPQLQSIIEEPELEPITEEPQLQPIMEEPELEPITEEPQLQPIIEEPELEPITEEPQLQPIMEESELPPIAEEPQLQPIIEQSFIDELHPDIEEKVSAENNLDLDFGSLKADGQKTSDLTNDDIKVSDEISAMMSDLDLSEDEEDSVLKPIMEQSELSPVIEEPKIQTIIEEDVSQDKSDLTNDSVMKSDEIPSMTADVDFSEGQENKVIPPIMKEPELNPIESETQLGIPEPETSTLGIESVEANPVAGEANKSMIETEAVVHQQSDVKTESEPQLRPIMTESDLEAMLNELEEHPRAALKEQPDKASTNNETHAAEEVKAKESDIELLDEDLLELSNGKMPDKIKAMIANLGTNETEEPSANLGTNETEEPSVNLGANTEVLNANQDVLNENLGIHSKDLQLDSSLGSIDNNLQSMESKHELDTSKEADELEIQPLIDDTESELDQIMKALDIDDIMETPEEDLDIDKILEVPLTGMKSGQSDADNDNQVMSSDEIAALIANTDLLSDPEPSKKNDGLPDLSDPGYVMSSDEIAALIANL